MTLNILKEMVTSLYTADVRLNPTKEARHCLVIYNEEDGILIIEKGLFSISFENTNALMKSDVIITNKKHIGDVNL